MLAAGAALFATAYTGLAVTGPAVAVLAECFVLAGAAIGCVETAQHTAIATLAPTDIRGSAFGLLAATQAFGNLIASSVAGAVWTLIADRRVRLRRGAHGRRLPRPAPSGTRHRRPMTARPTLVVGRHAWLLSQAWAACWTGPTARTAVGWR